MLSGIVLLDVVQSANVSKPLSLVCTFVVSTLRLESSSPKSCSFGVCPGGGVLVLDAESSLVNR